MYKKFNYYSIYKNFENTKDMVAGARWCSVAVRQLVEHCCRLRQGLWALSGANNRAVNHGSSDKRQFCIFVQYKT